jgi:hypothetical protein
MSIQPVDHSGQAGMGRASQTSSLALLSSVLAEELEGLDEAGTNMSS